MKGLAVIIGKSVHKNQDQVDEGPDSPQPAQKQADDTGTPFPHIHPMNAENAEEQAEDEASLLVRQQNSNFLEQA